MTASARKGVSERDAVIVASVILLVGLVAIMIWQAWVIPRSVGVPKGAEPMGIAAKLEEVEGQLMQIRQVDAGIGQLHENVEVIRRRLVEIEASQATMQAHVEAVGVMRDEHNHLLLQIEELHRHSARLESRVTELSEPRVEAEPSSDVYSEAPPQVLDRFDVSEKLLHDVRIVDASKELEYVVLDVGEKDGVRPGMIFHVMDGDQVMASLRVVHVRETLTGAKTEEIRGERFPEASDRVILRQYLD